MTAPSSTERKYQMVRIKAGDYLLPSNDGRTLWRIYRYHEGPDSGVIDPGTYWACARYDGTLEQAANDDELDYAWDRWVTTECWMKTRAEAIEAALSYRRTAA
jgi:hypothetical protein